MKNTIIAATLLAILSVSCNSKNSSSSDETSSETVASSVQYSCPMHPDMQGENGAECPECGMELTEKVKAITLTDTSIIPGDTLMDEVSLRRLKNKNKKQAMFPTEEIVADYLKVKNALAKDDAGNAAIRANVLKRGIDLTKSTSTDKKAADQYAKLLLEMRENASYVGDFPASLEIQREYFAKLSKNMFDLIQKYGASQVLYQDYCPMYANGKAGYWISETKDVVNPYFGAEMLHCGRRVAEVKKI